MLVHAFRTTPPARAGCVTRHVTTFLIGLPLRVSVRRPSAAAASARSPRGEGRAGMGREWASGRLSRLRPPPMQALARRAVRRGNAADGASRPDERSPSKLTAWAREAARHVRGGPQRVAQHTKRVWRRWPPAVDRQTDSSALCTCSDVWRRRPVSSASCGGAAQRTPTDSFFGGIAP